MGTGGALWGNIKLRSLQTRAKISTTLAKLLSSSTGICPFLAILRHVASTTTAARLSPRYSSRMSLPNSCCSTSPGCALAWAGMRGFVRLVRDTCHRNGLRIRRLNSRRASMARYLRPASLRAFPMAPVFHGERRARNSQEVRVVMPATSKGLQQVGQASETETSGPSKQ